MATMTVVEISNVGGPDVLQIAQRQIPEPRYGEVVIKTPRF